MITTTCTACGSTKSRKSMSYDMDLKGYCNSICCSTHPNAPRGLKERGTFADLMSYEEAMSIVTTRANELYKAGAQSSQKRTRPTVDVVRMLNDTISFRIREHAHSDYIMYVMGREGLNKVSQAMHTIINTAILSDQNYIKRAKGLENLHVVPIEAPPTPEASKPIPYVEQVQEDIFEV